MLIDEIRLFLSDYFDALHTQDLTVFDRVFHPACVLYAEQDGVLTVRPLPEYRRMVAGRAAPAALGQPRREEVLAMDVLSPTMAMVKVRLRLFDNIMEDHLNLMKHDGRWMVYAKHFHRAGAA